MPVIFFDLGDILGTPVFSPLDNHLEAFEVYPETREALVQLHACGLRLGILSNACTEPAETINRLLEESGIYRFFDPALILYDVKDSPAPFRRAAERAGCPPEECIFVGEDSWERRHAVEAGFRVAPHPSFVPPHVLDQIVNSPDPRIRNIAVDAIAVSSAARAVRATLATMPMMAAIPSPAGRKHRLVYDMRQRSFPLPGKLARSEGDPAGNDEAVNEAYDYAGVTAVVTLPRSLWNMSPAWSTILPAAPSPKSRSILLSARA